MTWALIGAGVLLFAGLLAFALWSQKKRGQEQAERDQYHGQVERARRANEIDEDVAGLSDDELRRELYDDG